MNKIKKLIFTATILASFSGILAMEKKNINIAEFFRSCFKNKTTQLTEIENIIKHFDNFQESIPYLHLQRKMSPIDKLFCTIQKTFLGYSWLEWKKTLEIKKLRAKEVKNYNEHSLHNPAIIPKNINITTQSATSYPSIDIQNLLPDLHCPDYAVPNIEKDNIQYTFKMNSIVTQQCPESLPFRYAYLLTGIERNSRWITYRNLALAKGFSGFGCLSLAYYLSQNPIIAVAGLLGGIIVANHFKGIIEQREHKARIQRAKQLIESNKEFSFKSEITHYPEPISTNEQTKTNEQIKIIYNIGAVKFKVSHTL